MSRILQILATDVREKTLLLLDAAHPAELTFQPPGTSNHLLWHAGHALWLQDVLCIQRVTGASALPPEYTAMFGMGSRPAGRREPWPRRDELHQHLEQQLRRLLELLGRLDEAELDAPSPYAQIGDARTLGESIVHGLHDEANHQGEMYLLLKLQRLAR